MWATVIFNPDLEFKISMQYANCFEDINATFVQVLDYSLLFHDANETLVVVDSHECN